MGWFVEGMLLKEYYRALLFLCMFSVGLWGFVPVCGTHEAGEGEAELLVLPFVVY